MSITEKYQRLYKYSFNLNYKVEHWYVSNKYDGIRGYYDFSSDTLYFRSGREVIRMEHIKEQCRQLCEEKGYSAVDGELYVPGLTFRKISSLVNGQKSITDEQKKTLRFVVFAVRNQEGEEDFTTPEMVEQINSIPNSYTNLIPVENTLVSNDDVEERARIIQGQGWEGIVLRNPVISYVEGGTRTLLKLVLPRIEKYKIIGFKEGTESYTGMLGSFEFEGTGIDETMNPIPVRGFVSSGLTKDMRKKVWENKEHYLNALINVRYQKATPIDEDGFGALRFPRFMGLVENCELVRAD